MFDLEAAGQAETGEEKILRKKIDKTVEKLIKDLMKGGASREKAERIGKTMRPIIAEDWSKLNSARGTPTPGE